MFAQYFKHLTLAITSLIITLHISASAGTAPATDTAPVESLLMPRQPAMKPSLTQVSPGVEIEFVVVKLVNDAAPRLVNRRLHSKSGVALSEVERVLEPYMDGRLERLFHRFSETTLESDREVLQYKSRRELADLNSYFTVEVSSALEAEDLVNRLNRLQSVEIAYVQPRPEEAGDISPPTPDYQASQDYREAAPAGVDADYANTLPGGDGTGVKIVDIENNWRTTHEDLDKAFGAIIGPIPSAGVSSAHGTAVLGEMVAGDNGYGVTGICPGADVGMVSAATMSTTQALYTAVAALEPGDMILIELHAPGPHYNFLSRPDQLGYVCMEYWQANYDAILYAWAKGITVMEAAGNGAENFDDPAIYGQLFDTTYRNSHAIIIGAGYPASSSDNLEKHGFSNYCARVKLQGYGSGVYTCGYGTLFDGDGDEDQYYTNSFSGTSSASPIVTGAGACLQGYYKANYGTFLTSDNIRDALVTTGTPQLGDTFQHIGPRPDLQTAIAALNPPPSLYASPIAVDTTVDEGTTANVDLWLYNRSATMGIDFTIDDSDTLTKDAGDWLAVSPLSGTIAPADSILIAVDLDGSAVEDRVEKYDGLLTIYWGPAGDATDSLALVPVYMAIPCNDLTYAAVSSKNAEGPDFNWIDARTLGSKVSFGSFYHNGGNPLDDGTTGPKNIGFKFPYYDTTFNRMYMGVNGAISFTDTAVNVNGYYSGLELPGAPFETFLAPFWSDLIFDTLLAPESGIYFYNDPSYDTAVIQWHHPANFNNQTDASLDFELILTLDGSIVFQYLDIGVSDLELSALLGISELECRAMSYVNSGDIPENIVAGGEAVRVYFTDRIWVMAGNVNGEDELDIADLVHLVDYMFNDGPEPIPLESGNIDCLGDVIDISDLIYLIPYMFENGPQPCWYLQYL